MPSLLGSSREQIVRPRATDLPGTMYVRVLTVELDRNRQLGAKEPDSSFEILLPSLFVKKKPDHRAMVDICHKSKAAEFSMGQHFCNVLGKDTAKFAVGLAMEIRDAELAMMPIPLVFTVHARWSNFVIATIYEQVWTRGTVS